MEKQESPSGNVGVVLTSQTELFLLWFPPTAAPFKHFMAELSPSLLVGAFVVGVTGSQRGRRTENGLFPHLSVSLSLVILVKQLKVTSRHEGISYFYRRLLQF